MIAGASAAAAILSASSFLMPFHSGGLVRHQGGAAPVYTAHAGLSLAPDERLIKAQIGEFVMSRRGVAAAGVPALAAINQGRLPGGGTAVTNVTIVTPAGQVLARRQIKQVLGAVGKSVKHRQIRGPA
jgi:hypothetical protein